MKKLLKASLSVVMLAGLMLHTTPYALASSVVNTAFENLSINYETDTGQDGATKQQIVDELLAEGLLPSEAEYYAKLDILINKIKEENISINLDEIEGYSDIDTPFKMLEIKEKALNLDLRAFKTLFQSSIVKVKGDEDLSQFSASLDGNEKINQVTIKYADGSYVKKTTTVTDISVDEGYTTDTNILGPWSAYGQEDMFRQQFHTSTGTKSAATGVTFASPDIFATVTNVFHYQLRNNGSTNPANWTAIPTGSDGTGNSRGVSSPPNYYSKITGQTATGNYQWIQAYTQAKFVSGADIEGSVELWGSGLSYKLTAHSSWNQYAITEVSGSSVLSWEALY